MVKRTKQEKKPKENGAKSNKKSNRKVEQEEVVEDEKILTEQEEKSSFEDVQVRYENSADAVKSSLLARIDKAQVEKAIEVLKKIVADKYKNSLNLLQDEQEEFVFINFVFGRLPEKYSMKPVAVSLTNSVYGQSFHTRVCLFVRDPRSDFKELGVHKELPFKLKVLDIAKLKQNFSRFQDRRNLLKEYELFLCDAKIYMLLKKLLGKPFYVAKKYPLPLKLDYSNPEEIKQEITSKIEDATTFHMSHGPNYSVKVARVAADTAEVQQNVFDAITQTLPHILKWNVDLKDLKSISLKSTNTVDLPVFNQLTEEEIKVFSCK